MQYARIGAVLFGFGLAVGSVRAVEQELPFVCDFEAPATLDAWGGDSGNIVPGREGGRALKFHCDAAGAGATRRIRVSLAPLGGRLITLRATVKAEEVSRPPKPWNGIKVMLVLERPVARPLHLQVPIPVGTFDWTVFSHSLRLPPELTSATLVVGLEAVSGTVWIDNLEIRPGRAQPVGRRQPERFTGHELPRLRGVMYGPHFRRPDLRDLAQDWRANQVRWQLNWTPMKPAEEWARDLDRYQQWLSGALEDCDRALDACEELGLKVLVDLHTPPGGRADGGVCRMFSEARYRDALIETWQAIARRYQGRDVAYAYDLVNEPVEPRAGGIVSWRDLATRVTRAIRAIDPGKPVVFEPGPWGSPDGFDQMIPLGVDRVIYSFHMYQPHAFTHQGVQGQPLGPIYPGIIAGEQWHKERLRRAMAPAIDFQREFNVQIYVGEFSAVRWAPDESAFHYLEDVIALFEEYRWDWSYHAFREWHGWSVEHDADPKTTTRATIQTARERLLRRYFAENVRPTAEKQ